VALFTCMFEASQSSYLMWHIVAMSGRTFLKTTAHVQLAGKCTNSRACARGRRKSMHSEEHKEGDRRNGRCWCGWSPMAKTCGFKQPLRSRRRMFSTLGNNQSADLQLEPALGIYWPRAASASPSPMLLQSMPAVHLFQRPPPFLFSPARMFPAGPAQQRFGIFLSGQTAVTGEVQAVLSLVCWFV